MTKFQSTRAIRGLQTTFWPKSYFDDFHSAQWGGGWVGGQLATFPKCPETKFPEAVHEQSVLSQKMKNFRWKMAQRSYRHNRDPIIISGKSKSWVLAGRWQMLCYKVLSYQHRPTSGTPKEPTEALQTHLQSTKTIRGLPKGVWPTFGKSKILTIFNGVVGGSGVNWQLFRNALASIFLSHHMDRGSWAKRWKFLKNV